MCDLIQFKNGNDVETVRQFQDTFKVDATKYGFDGNEQLIDQCLCNIDLEQFFKDHPEHEFYYDYGDWWEGKKRT